MITVLIWKRVCISPDMEKGMHNACPFPYQVCSLILAISNEKSHVTDQKQ